MPEETDKAFNALAITWRRGANGGAQTTTKIITAEEAQHLNQMHFAVCPTNPMVMQNRKEETHHSRQLEQEEREKSAKLKKTNVFDPAMSHCTTYLGATIFTCFYTFLNLLCDFFIIFSEFS